MLRLSRFNTLRFKACLFTLLLVVTMCLFFILLGNGSLQSLLEKNRESRYLSFQHQISGLLQQSRQEVMQLAEMIALNEHGRISSRDELRKVMNRQWELLQHSWGLHSLKIYGDASEPILTWGAPHANLSPEVVQQVLRRGQPLERVRCDNACEQSLSVPMHSHSGDYVLQVDRALSQQLQRFRVMTGSDIGIISDVRDGGGEAGSEQASAHLATWGRDVLALTSRERLLPLLVQAAEKSDLEGLQAARIQQFDNRQYDIKAMRVDVGGEGAYFLFIDDVTGQVQHIKDSLKLLLLFSVLGALVFSAAVAGILWRPTERLRRLSEALPLLTNGRFADARHLIEPVYKTSGRFDELDVLDNTGLTVCEQLEDMNDMVSRKTAQLEQIAMHDCLTGLDNRYSLMEQLEHYLEGRQRQSAQERERGYLFFIDLDDFKHVNDTLGHQGGDELLSVIARRLLSAMRCGDIVARLGGDEFCVFVRNLPEPEAYKTLAEKMLNTVAQPVKVVEHLVEVTMSVGVVAVDERGDTLAGILQKADTAMYYAKRNGKNKYQLYSTELPALTSSQDAQTARGSVANLELITGQPR
ncbi:diguanylate cyclase [uncultured Microbulbifer sp.]|uniref:diguanylate cyclase domain-containing protein n=1 Tax=uncultured Microbulbifer sp. TaxID=348147 RepID=UPI0025E914EF|nr:diguanylate cyclase [uncultured Microbulbifer sp.]